MIRENPDPRGLIFCHRHVNNSPNIDDSGDVRHDAVPCLAFARRQTITANAKEIWRVQTVGMGDDEDRKI